jgi:hypothetical protein
MAGSIASFPDQQRPQRLWWRAGPCHHSIPGHLLAFPAWLPLQRSWLPRHCWLCATCPAAAGNGGTVAAIYSLGDSITDTGNLVKEAPPDMFETIKHFPYGVTFGRPTGRCSDGLLIIDFLGT